MELDLDQDLDLIRNTGDSGEPREKKTTSCNIHDANPWVASTLKSHPVNPPFDH